MACDSELDYLLDLLNEDSQSCATKRNDEVPDVDTHSQSQPLLASLNNVKPSRIDMESSEEYSKCSENDDALETELAEMEKRMNVLKEQLIKKKNLQSSENKIGFTRLSSVAEKSSETVRNLENHELTDLLNKVKNCSESEVHTGDTDSEDDEDNRNPLEPRLSNFGRDIKHRLANSNASEPTTTSQTSSSNYSNKKQGWEGRSSSLLPMGKPVNDSQELNPGFLDPVSGIRLINPLISTRTLEELMRGRRLIHMSSIVNHFRGGEIEGDWVTFGVIVSKSETKTSQKGAQYSIWRLNDLRDCTKVVSLFLFSGAFSKLWKTTTGSVIGILNPDIMKERQDKGNYLTLSVNNHEKVLIMGVSKDLGTCKSRTKLGNCAQFVNKNVCEFCIYHIQKEYRKTCSKRSEIQSSFTRVDPRKALQKKVFGSNQVFYGGQLFGISQSDSGKASSRKAPSSHRAKDLATLSSLKIKLKAKDFKEEDKRNSFILNNLSQNQINAIQEVAKETDGLGEKLLAPTPGARNLLLHKSKSCDSESDKSANPIHKLSAKDLLKATMREKALQKKLNLESAKPLLGLGLSPSEVLEFDVLLSPSTTKADVAKNKALHLLKQKGGLRTQDKHMKRNRDKASSLGFQENIKKKMKAVEDMKIQESEITRSARIEVSDPLSCLPIKQSLLGSVDINSSKFQEIMNAKSKNCHLIQAEENEEVEKYYNTLEKKEMIENKMISTMEVPTSAMVCLKCKYKALSASDYCKSNNHPLKSIKATKRFYECRNCRRRTATLDKLPTKPCSNCSQSSWKRVGMGKEKEGPKLESEILSLRGDELTHYSGSSSEVFLHL